jgi:glycosyltransferase involved in cell wall biosynthesis
VRVKEFDPRSAFVGRYKILHVHWPDALVKNVSSFKAVLRLLGLLMLLAAARARGKQVVWTVHNVKPHGGFVPRVVRFMRRILARFVTGLVLLSPETRPLLELAHSGYAKSATSVIPHPYYPKYAAIRERREGAIARVNGIKRFVMAGSLAAYKAPDTLIEVFKGVPSDGYELLVAGACDDIALRQRLVRLANDAGNVELELGWLDDLQLVDAMLSADVVVLPYTSILNSGSVLAALSVGRRVLAPRIGNLPAVAGVVGDDWLWLYDPPLLPEHLVAAARALPSGAPRLGQLSVESVARQHYRFYRQLTGGDVTRT